MFTYILRIKYTKCYFRDIIEYHYLIVLIFCFVDMSRIMKK